MTKKSREYPVNKHQADKFSVRLEDMEVECKHGRRGEFCIDCYREPKPTTVGTATERLLSADPPEANPPRPNIEKMNAPILGLDFAEVEKRAIAVLSPQEVYCPFCNAGIPITPNRTRAEKARGFNSDYGSNSPPETR